MHSLTLRASASLLLVPLAAAIAALVLLPAIHVSAHAAYDHSTPGDGDVIATSPPQLDAYFKEEISKANGLPTLYVVNDSGDLVDTGTFADPSAVLDDTDRTHISDPLKPNLPDGRYTVIWHTVSADDGDEAEGAFHFYIGSGPTAVPTASPGNGTTTPIVSIPAVTPQPSSSSSSKVPIWGLIIGIVGGVVVGGGGGLIFGRRGGI